MERVSNLKDGVLESSDVEDEYRSCCTEVEEWKDTEESLADGVDECCDDYFVRMFFKGVSVAKDGGSCHRVSKKSLADGVDECLDEFSVRMFFKGVSVAKDGGSGHRVSGIGVVMERQKGLDVLQIQKKLDFFVEESVAEHLALMDGLLEALRNGMRRVFAYTDSEEVYEQIAETEELKNPLLVALGERIMEHVDKLEDFVLKLVTSDELCQPFRLAQEAIGQWPVNGSFVECPVCCEEKEQSEMIKLTCSHRFCADCMMMYTKGKIQTSQVPIRCPELRCKYRISVRELKTFLPLACHEWLERDTAVVDVLEEIYCPFPNCSAPLSPSQCLPSGESLSSQSDVNCIECPECSRFICIHCGVPWHASMTCEEYQILPVDEGDEGEITLHRLAQNNRWRQCQQCRRIIELTQGCYHMTCWCGHQFCYSCGAEYREGAQTCQCEFFDDDTTEPSVASSNQESEQWRWESFDRLPAVIDAYSEQERSQLALIQRFLTGGVELGDHHHPCQSPPRCSDSYVDTIKDLHQLPWLERFVSVISDNYQETYS